jgi:hypothetical protein
LPLTSYRQAHQIPDFQLALMANSDRVIQTDRQLGLCGPDVFIEE